MNMVKLLNHKVTSIDPENKSVTAVDKDSKETKTIQYDSVIIATGASPFVPPVPGARELLDKGVFVVSDPENSKKVVHYSKGVSHAVVVGAAAIGLEVGAAIKANNIDVKLVEMLPHSFPKSIDPDIARILEKGLKKSDMKLMIGASLEKIYGDNKVTSLTVNGESLPADIVIMASDVRANWDLAKDASVMSIL